ncbi:MAG: hypothetical protein ABEN55_10175 [Bradymonadaceae bacterium]
MGEDAGDGADTTKEPRGGCSGDTPVCDEESGTYVECLGNGDCSEEGASVCDNSTNTCVACLPANKPDWYPDSDGDGFGDERGNDVKSKVRVGLNAAEISGLDVARIGGGYGVVATVPQQDGSTDLNALQFSASLNQKGSPALIELNTEAIAGPSATAKVGTLWTAYTYQTGNGKHDVRAAGINLQTGEVATGPVKDLDSGNDLPGSGAPEIAMVNGTPTVAWWDARTENLHGARLKGEGVDTRFDVATNVVNLAKAESIAFFGRGGKAHLVYPDYGNSTASGLQYLAVGPNATGTVSGATAITGDSETDRRPSARPIDADGDGQVDHLFAVWARGSNTDPRPNSRAYPESESHSRPRTGGIGTSGDRPVLGAKVTRVITNPLPQ